MPQTEQIRAGIIGLGAMGIGMAQTLSRNGFEPAAFDLSETALSRATDAGAAAMPSAADVFGAAQVIVLSLPAAHHVKAVIAEAESAGHLAQGSAPRIVIDTSTSEAEISRALASRLAAAGHGFVDAPVSGGPSGAAAGTLAMMLGGEEAHVARAMPVLEALGQKIIHVGPSGAGNVAKLVNNMLVASHMITTLEALKLAEASGVSAEAALGVINAATGRSAISEIHYPTWVLPRSFDSGFSTGLMRKDVRLALEMAAAKGCAMPLADLVAELWSEGRSGLADDDDFMLMGDPGAARFEGDER
ncbi:3-hydroxyisobutyrate dehydrogenase [Pelagivirga sediminicola]|uniref:3-hydroxyisobutyrate dehydrogenase n=1 Tax=Pelagivirga sediminicola TaxID=2170575 RepID=A0A2T7G867_9RHOB|nr:NAD(P)-dependent oxidoreductase [Pelagivirga sediminicola]PVA10608.1 3-hydroxyisobutyrate dehydrogenase [Pelagivirga sediminicola]